MASQRGWQIFLVGLLISLFFGGAIRVLFSPQRVRAWVEDTMARREPKFTLEFKEARLTLADGILPQLAIEFKNLIVKAKDTCLTGSEISVERANIPLQMRQLLKKQIRLGHIVLDQMIYRYRDPICPQASAVVPEVSSMKAAPLKDFLQRRWAREIENTYRLVDQLTVTYAKIYLGDAVDPVFEVNDFSAHVLRVAQELKIKGELVPGVKLTGAEALGSLRFNAGLSNAGLKLNGRGNIKEGQYHLNFLWQVSDETFESELQLQDLPMRTSLDLLARWGLVRIQNFNPRNQWLSCRVKVSGKNVDWQNADTFVDECRFYGDLGLWRVRGGKMALLKGELYPLLVDVKDMNLKAFAEAAGWQHLLDFVVQPGALSFLFEFAGRDYFSLQGVWHKPIMQYKVGNYVMTLPILQLQVGIDHNQKSMGLNFRDLVWSEGKIEGVLQYEKDRLTAAQQLNWSVKAELVPEIMLAFLGFKELHQMESQGEVHFESGVIQQARVQSSFRGGRGFDANFSDAAISWSFKNGSGQMKADIKTLRLNESKRWQPWRDAAGLSEADILNVSAVGRMDLDWRWQIDRIQGQSALGPIEFTGRGFKVGIDQSTLRLQDKESKKWRTFLGYGTLLEPRVEANQ